MLDKKGVKMKKYTVQFLGGEMRDGEHSGNYMIVQVKDLDGDAIELYAEYPAPELGSDSVQDDLDSFDEQSYPVLKREIIRQAAAVGVSADELNFPLD